MTELRSIVKEKGLNIYEIILDNEMAITGASRPSIIYSLNQIIDHMESSVRRGLDSEGQLPGPLKVQRKARMLWQQASRMQSSPDQFLTRINAYAFATAEKMPPAASSSPRRPVVLPGSCPLWCMPCGMKCS